MNNNNNNNEDKVDMATSDASNVNSSDAITKLGVLISSLMDFVKTKNNVHHSIKEQVRTIRVTYNKALDELRVKRTGTSEHVEKATQTSPKVPYASIEAKKRSRDVSDESPKFKSNKRKKKAPSPNETNDVTPPSEKVDDIAPPSEWSTVIRRKRKQQKKSRPNAMIISANGETTYADILRKIKADPDLQDFGKSVRRIRRTQKGELLLEIDGSNKDGTGELNELVGKSLEGKAEIRTKISETLIEFKDLDEITTKADICAALEDQLNVAALEESVVKSIRKAYGGTQIAKISLPDGIAQKALKMGKLKIGWSVCRVREPLVLKRCFRCLEFGHIASSCKNIFDRSKLCRKCGEANHIAKDCTSEPRCMFCVANKDPETGHTAGSSKCPVFRKALSSLKK